MNRRTFLAGCCGMVSFPATTRAEDGATPGPPAKATQPHRIITNSIGMKLVHIPAGSFLMGTPATEQGRRPDEGPVHRVVITKPFYMGMYEVTQQEYRTVTGHNPSEFSASGEGKERVKGMDTSRFPVDSVNWADAVAFCKQLSRRAKERKAGRRYRLPTEAQWEYCCRAATTTPFAHGKTLTGANANFNTAFPYGAKDGGRWLQRPTRVGSYAPNAFGLYDLAGNIGEWCADYYGPSYYAKSPRQDPAGPSRSTFWGARSVRGGCWATRGCFLRSGSRSCLDATERTWWTGFRVVCELTNES